MKKELIFEAFFKEKSIPNYLLESIKNKKDFFENFSQDPCNSETNDSYSQNDLKENSSQKSSFSKIIISQEKYLEVLENREQSKLFQTISGKDNIFTKVWFYKTSQQEVLGPFSSLQMDEFFNTKIIDEDSEIQGHTDSKFTSLRIFIRKFLKIVHLLKSKEVNEINHYRGSGQKSRNNSKTVGLLIERKSQLLSNEVSQKLCFVDAIEEDSELSEFITTRVRSSTMRL